jgi:hypothetical protein
VPSSTSSSEKKGEALLQKPLRFDPEHVERPLPAHSWRVLFVAAIVVTLVLTAGWEVYWRGKMFSPGEFKNTAGLWAQERRKAKDDATVMIGSSRILFDMDLDVWEAQSGLRPVQLALEGTSPRIFLKDLANDEEFNGMVIVGVTTILFFTQEGGLRASVLDYYADESPSQRIGFELSKGLDRMLAFFDEQTRPKRQMQIAYLPLREGMKPRFDPRKLEVMGPDRNTKMWDRLLVDERYLKEAQGQWLLAFEVFAPPPGPDGQPMPMPDAAIDAVIAEVKANIDKIRARGGDVAFLRLPYNGPFAEVEDMGFPRERFWDRLLERTDSVGVTFHDHPELQGYEIPEWSHLSPSDATRYTRALVPIFYAELERKKAERAAR